MALKYAIENGADTKSSGNDHIDDSIFFSMNINGTNSFIYFARHICGSIYLSVSDADKQRGSPARESIRQIERGTFIHMVRDAAEVTCCFFFRKK